MTPEWIDDCLKYRGEILTGHYRHWCCEWDDLPVDETCIEWPCCSYEPEDITEAQRQGARRVNARIREEFDAHCDFWSYGFPIDGVLS